MNLYEFASARQKAKYRREQPKRPFITLSKPPCGSPKKSQKAINDDVHEAYGSGFGDIITSSNQTHPARAPGREGRPVNANDGPFNT